MFAPGRPREVHLHGSVRGDLAAAEAGVSGAQIFGTDSLPAQTVLGAGCRLPLPLSVPVQAQRVIGNSVADSPPFCALGSAALVARRCGETGVVTSLSGSSVFAGLRFPREIIAVAVRWYLRYGLSCRDVEELAGRDAWRLPRAVEPPCSRAAGCLRSLPTTTGPEGGHYPRRPGSASGPSRSAWSRHQPHPRQQ